jgi:uncharacterized protein YbjT (DUF2867 family)
MKNILLIGGHGMLGRPVARRLVQEGFNVRAMARSVGRAAGLLPQEVQVVEGDVGNPGDIERAAEGVDAVYLNLETPDPKAAFRPELDGTRMVVQALQSRPQVLLAKISAIEMGPEIDWPYARQKRESEQVLEQSGHPYLIFRPTWFMESLPVFVRGNRLVIPGRPPHPLYWVAGDDLARWVVGALGSEPWHNRTITVQGPEPLTFRQAAQRFVAAWQPGLRITHTPLWPLALIGRFKPQIGDFVTLMRVTSAFEEAFQSRDVWDALGPPQLTIEGYVDSIRSTGDFPKKAFG